MNQFRTSAFFINLALILLSSPHPAHADQQWHYQTAAQVLPAGVFFGTDGVAKTPQLDLTLVGPDQVNQLTYDHEDEHADR